MTDKQIIIDGVDVSGCEFLIISKDKQLCRCIKSDLFGGIEFVENAKNGNCKDNPNCYYKQFKRKEQECEGLKAKFQDMKKSRDIALKEYNEEFEYKRQITVEHLEQKKELLKQLDQLKTENEELKKQNNQFDNGINEQFSKIIELEGRNNFLKQTLTEIKEIVEIRKDDINDWLVKEILQKINEVQNGV